MWNIKYAIGLRNDDSYDAEQRPIYYRNEYHECIACNTHDISTLILPYITRAEKSISTNSRSQINKLAYLFIASALLDVYYC